MSKLPVSAYIITLNEEAYISKLLSQLSAFDEIVLVDSGSTDETILLAGKFPNVRIYYRQWTGFSDQKNYALSLCRNQWVLNLDADEELGAGYMDAITTLLEKNHADALEGRRILYRHGRIPRNFFKDDILIRIFRKSCGHYEAARVHEKLTITGKIQKTDAVILHYEDLSFTQRIAKSNQYSQLKAEDKFDQGKQCSLLVLLLVFPFSFLRCYVLKGCFLDGVEDLLTSMNHSYYNFMKYAKLWEMQREHKPVPDHQSSGKVKHAH